MFLSTSFFYCLVLCVRQDFVLEQPPIQPAPSQELQMTSSEDEKTFSTLSLGRSSLSTSSWLTLRSTGSDGIKKYSRVWDGVEESGRRHAVAEATMTREPERDS